MQKGHTRDIVNAKMRAKYGVESNISQNSEVRKKITETVTKKYGGYTFASKELSEKCKQTSLEKYGTEYPTQSDEIKEKTRNTVQQKYGVDNVFQSDEIKHRIQETCLVKYGVNWAGQSPEIAENRRKSIIQNYANTIVDPLKRQNYLNFMDDPIQYVKSHFDTKPTLYDVKDSIGGLDDSTIYFRLGEGNSRKLLSRIYSTMEKDIRDFIQSLDLNIIIYENDRKIISPKEIDLYN